MSPGTCWDSISGLDQAAHYHILSLGDFSSDPAVDWLESMEMIFIIFKALIRHILNTNKRVMKMRTIQWSDDYKKCASFTAICWSFDKYCRAVESLEGWGLFQVPVLAFNILVNQMFGDNFSTCVISAVDMSNFGIPVITYIYYVMTNVYWRPYCTLC
jgi:hypothetical protein